MGNPLAASHLDIDGHACDGVLAVERTGLYRCPKCGALAESAEGVVFGHGDEEAA